LVRFIRQQGVQGVGQSSWGPAVFAVVRDNDQAEQLANRIQRRFTLGISEVFATCAHNQGAMIAREAG